MCVYVCMYACMYVVAILCLCPQYCLVPKTEAEKLDTDVAEGAVSGSDINIYVIIDDG